MAILTSRPNSHPFDERKILLTEASKVGRSVAKSRPAQNNCIFDCKVLSRNHAIIWFENDKVRPKTLLLIYAVLALLRYIRYIWVIWYLKCTSLSSCSSFWSSELSLKAQNLRIILEGYKSQAETSDQKSLWGKTANVMKRFTRIFLSVIHIFALGFYQIFI